MVDKVSMAAMRDASGQIEFSDIKRADEAKNDVRRRDNIEPYFSNPAHHLSSMKNQVRPVGLMESVRVAWLLMR